jgi:hypothetical protein
VTIAILSAENVKLDDSIKESEKEPFTDFDDISASEMLIKKFFPLVLSPLILIIYLVFVFKKSCKDESLLTISENLFSIDIFPKKGVVALLPIG